jgi:general secretion pathway protein K
MSMRALSGKSSQKGIALLIVLWIMAILIVVVLSFSLMMRKESQAAFFFKEGTEKKYFAEAAIQRAVMELFYRSLNKDQKIILEGKEVLRVDGTVYQGQIGEGRYAFKITNEAGKINVSGLGDDTGILLKNLLMNSGIRETLADTIVDSVLDWKDADDFHRLNGAESDYYLSLPNPYKARNAAFETLEELLMVKGVTPEILFGSGDKAGLIHFLTVHSNTGKIDVDTAPKEVLMAIPGMTADAAERIIEYRKTTEIRDMGVIKEVIGVEIFTLLEPYMAVNETNTYSIDVVGYKDNIKKGFSIRTTVMLGGPSGCRYLYYKSPAENLL